MKIYEIRWKSSEDKKPAWNRAKVSIRAANRRWPFKARCEHPCPEMHENQWEFIKIYGNPRKATKIYENLWNTMKVFRGQEANLESTKGFYRGNKSNFTVLNHPCSEIYKIYANPRKSMKIYENPLKSMIIDRKRWKSSDDKKPAWNRAKVSIGAASCPLPSVSYTHLTLPTN